MKSKNAIIILIVLIILSVGFMIYLFRMVNNDYTINEPTEIKKNISNDQENKNKTLEELMVENGQNRAVETESGNLERLMNENKEDESIELIPGELERLMEENKSK